VTHLNRGINKKVSGETFKHFCRSFFGFSNSHILSICLVAQSELGRVCCLQKEFGLCLGLIFLLVPLIILLLQEFATIVGEFKDSYMKVNYQEKIDTTTTELKIIMAQQRTATRSTKSSGTLFVKIRA
jgi:hypothetical protein